MEEKKTPILNKYDIHAVEAKLNEFLTETLTTDLHASKVVFHEYFKLVFGLAFSAVILLSYFHKTPFPQDKPQIALCVVLYGVMSLIMSAYTRFRLQGAFAEFNVPVETLPAGYEALKKSTGANNIVLKLKSDVKDFTSDYTLTAIAGDKRASKTIAYNEYVDDEGYLVEGKTKQLLASLLKSL